MPEIYPILPEQAAEARRMIYSVAHLIFPGGETVAESIEYYKTHWPMPDLNDIQHAYFENGGTFQVVMEGGQIVGTGAIRRLEDTVCELKRFWFRPEYHGTGLSLRLLEQLFEIARQMGYRKMRLETSAVEQARAVAFYKKHGFIEIPRYGDEPDDISMERILG